MGRKRKITRPKTPLNVTYHKELHHTCNNTAICREQIQPCDECAKCKYYEHREVEVADSPIRLSVDWGF